MTREPTKEQLVTVRVHLISSGFVTSEWLSRDFEIPRDVSTGYVFTRVTVCEIVCQLWLFFSASQ